ncbi:Os03g0693650 [Oryza sativa Japonica Group]|uniref:Os03g0693650 protein n=1 Tax=Oryza sativa subsp. japonica TaxID=39947 RepID=A0A0P0W1K8_ORYSJ|nr:hypothetical protein EE612_019820 [Oryza sativa]BAS85862.1 Os03g0693650 [Oryza sativa Japonica Group]
MGTPKPSASRVEFQPQCVTKHPVARCASTSSWGLHRTTSASPDAVAASRRWRGSCASSVALTTHRNGLPAARRPRASSSVWAAPRDAKLPKET